MHFIHIADCHLGGWGDPKMKQLNLDSFFYVMDYTIEKKVDFLLIAGDLFNTSIPPLDILKKATQKIKEVHDKGIPIYIIAGSHDYSPSGKTMLDVLENAGLVENVVKGEVVEGKLRLKFTVDPKTGVKITGMLGKRGMLDKKYYEQLDFEALEKEEGKKIFMFHTAVDELKTEELKNMDSMGVSLFPKGFDFYAGGHVHIRERYNQDRYKNVIYPGPTFPNSFSELESLHYGSFIEYDNGEVIDRKIELKNVEVVKVSCKEKTPSQVRDELHSKLESLDVNDKIILIRLYGKLAGGSLSEIRINEFVRELNEKGAFFVMRSTTMVKTVDLEEIKIEMKDNEKIEEELIDEHIGKIKVGLSAEDEKDLTRKLISVFSDDKKEGEKKDTFEKRIEDNVDALLGL